MNDFHGPGFYVCLNASDNAYYFTGNGHHNGFMTEGDGIYRLSCGARVTVEQNSLPGSTAVRVRTTLENAADGPVCVELLGSSFTDGIGRGGSRPWKKNRFVIHYTETCWTGEAQWRHVYAEQAGLYRTYNHGTQSSFRISSQSSWSTCRHEPVVMVEDTELHETYFAEAEAGHGWCINVGIRGYRDDIGICILTTDCLEKNDGWHVILSPGQSVTSCYSTVGRVDGGFEEAVAELTAAHRAINGAPFKDGLPPLCFNDYMNCLWALPTREKTIPLAEAAAKAGCEYYVIDAGWYNVNKNEERDLGMWQTDDALFGEGGLQRIFDDIKALGMKPGIWFEFESAGIDADILKKHPEYMLRRHGHPVGGRRVLLDFRQQGVRDHIRERVECLYGMGVRYIKNDYNANTGAGIDPDGAVSVHDHSAAFNSFIDGLRASFPDLLIENCGSGAMRSDMETLSHFHLQSVSDQEDYFRLPSIVSGSECCYPPEKCGIWAYPYPVRIDRRADFRPSEDFTKRFADGEVTSYCMVTGLMGLMYLSGRIDCADEYNFSLIKEAADIYKANRPYITRSYPVFPTGTFDIDTEETNSFGLNDKEDGVLMLAVWNNSGKQSSLDTDLSKYTGGKTPRICTVYPSKDDRCASLDGSLLTVKLPAGKSAIYIKAEYR